MKAFAIRCCCGGSVECTQCNGSSGPPYWQAELSDWGQFGVITCSNLNGIYVAPNPMTYTNAPTQCQWSGWQFSKPEQVTGNIVVLIYASGSIKRIRFSYDYRINLGATKSYVWDQAFDGDCTQEFTFTITDRITDFGTGRCNSDNVVVVLTPLFA